MTGKDVLDYVDIQAAPYLPQLGWALGVVAVVALVLAAVVIFRD